MDSSNTHHPHSPTEARSRRRLRMSLAVVLTVSSCAFSACSGPAKPREMHMIAIDGTGSGIANRQELLALFETEVMPDLSRNKALAVVALIGDRTSTNPVVVTADYGAAVDDAKGNGFVERRNIEDTDAKLRSDVEAALANFAPTPTSDPVSALALATQVKGQVPERPFHLTLLGDALSTIDGCNLLTSDLSTVPARSALIDSCTAGLIIDLSGADVVIGGAGVDPDDPLATARAGQVETFWRELIARFHGQVITYGAVLVGGL